MIRIATLWIALVVLTACASSSPPVPENDEQLDTPVTPRVSVPLSTKETKYQVIVSSFEFASEVPDVNDFDPLDVTRPLLRCLSVKDSDPDVMTEIVIRQMSVSRSGTPSYGPLFPGTPDRVETTLAIGMNNGWVNSKNLTPEKRRVFELHSLGGSLVIRIVENQFGIYQDLGNPAEVWLRKGAGGNIFFKVFRLDAEQNRAEAFVGYCFRR